MWPDANLRLFPTRWLIYHYIITASPLLHPDVTQMHTSLKLFQYPCISTDTLPPFSFSLPLPYTLIVSVFPGNIRWCSFHAGSIMWSDITSYIMWQTSLSSIKGKDIQLTMHSSHSSLNIHQSDTFKPLTVDLKHTINPSEVQSSAGNPRILTFIWRPTGKNYNPVELCWHEGVSSSWNNVWVGFMGEGTSASRPAFRVSHQSINI